ncbi:ATP-dependent helicase [Geomicrobium sp. JCM 19039]|uniref:ATP-dependent helicase n=1 Tax=Geomicrobium sp. JCM 19039 TaxID=1460636 RepID=UPI00045F1794|nr:ATP-dependent helicase [Geomicrobium sp. JCM 19039]GAK10469.1 putative ATP-dependent DNA helicase YjcD [Geomicrobium sp. JCM 19039]
MDFFARMQQETGVELNDVQKQAVYETDGPLLLLATPGSGKTTTLNMKIGYLLLEKQVAPSSIMAVTFSRAGAEDMSERFDQFFSNMTRDRVHFSTIHSFAFRIVREYFQKQRQSFQVIEGKTEGMYEKRRLLAQLYTKVTGKKLTEDEMESLATYITYVKNRMTPKAELSAVKCSVDAAKDVYLAYESFKKNETETLLLDFDDMLVYAYEVLQVDRDIRTRYQKQYAYVLTDESQDNSLIQHAIVEIIAKPRNNLCVVADDDQSVFMWRGSDVNRLLEFKHTYPDATVLTMNRNYRSSSQIVKAANTFIKRNENRYEKNMYTENREAAPISFHHFKERQVQISHLEQAVTDNDNHKELAILYRNNLSAVAIVDMLERNHIPFYMKEVDTKFLRHWVTQDVLNFMRFSYHTGRVDVLEKIYMKFNGYIKKVQMQKLKAEGSGACAFDRLLQDSPEPYQVKRLKEAKSHFEQVNKLSPEAAIKIIEQELGYRKTMAKTSEALGFNLERATEVLDALKQIAKGLPTLKAFANRLQRLEQIMKESKFKKHDEVLTLSTLHRSKGLEFDCVYVVDVNKDVLPTKEDANDPALMEEAVRLFYVGITRAREHLELLSSGTPSSFFSQLKSIIDVPAGALNHGDFEVNTEVIHNKFGRGTIIDYNKESVRIDFHEHGEKEFLKQFCIERAILQKA